MVIMAVDSEMGTVDGAEDCLGKWRIEGVCREQ